MPRLYRNLSGSHTLAAMEAALTVLYKLSAFLDTITCPQSPVYRMSSNRTAGSQAAADLYLRRTMAEKCRQFVLVLLWITHGVDEHFRDTHALSERKLNQTCGCWGYVRRRYTQGA
jgi:hypothetical protein